MASRSGRQNALYEQFCIGVELGDDILVRDLLQRGADTMVSYSVDGKLTTPMQSALSKGDMSMTLALLNSPATRVRLADLDLAARVKKEQIHPLLVRRLSVALEEGAAGVLVQRPPAPRTRAQKIALADTVADYLRAEKEDRPSSLPHASPTDKPRCPPPGMLSDNQDVLDESSDEDEESEEDKSSPDDQSSSSSAEEDDDD